MTDPISGPQSRWAIRHGCTLLVVALVLFGCAHRERTDQNPIAAQLQKAEALQKDLQTTPGNGKSREKAQLKFDRQVSKVVSSLRDRLSPIGAMALTNGGLRVGPYLVQMPPNDHLGTSLSLSGYDHLYPADPTEERGITVEYARTGAGAALVGELGQSPELTRERTNFFGQRIYLPVTAVLDFPASGSTAPRPAQLRLVDPHIPPEKVPGLKGQVLSANYTAAARLSLAREAFLKSAWLGLLWPGLHLEESGLFLLEPYRPDKIPVVLVHGLYSSPATWLEMASAIQADPALSRRFQLWYFIYPTGMPIPGSAHQLRTSLNDAVERLDPGLQQPTSHEMVLIGHSMGGILSRLQTTESGDLFWTNFFSKPVEKLNVRDSIRRDLKESFFFDRLPCVSRVIFIATPHRGSGLADLWLSRWFVRLIHLPATTVQTASELLTMNVDAIRPDLLKYQKLGLTSVESLSPGNPLYRAMEQRPIPVPFHSIIANRGNSGTNPTSDGVVPYDSAHLTNAQSELIIPAGHACTDSRAAISEVKRILHVHLEGFDERHAVTRGEKNPGQADSH
jgi:pimeloyl-ACP methyl ester carboxylesterase